MKRGAPRPDAIGAASAVPTTNSVSGSVVSTNNSIPIGNTAQTSAQLTRTHESSPQPSVVPYGNIHSTPGQNIVHINSASLNCIRSLTPQPSASGQSLRTVNTSVGINLSGIGTPVSGQITIPASAVSAAAAAHHLHSGATNLILRQTNQNLVNPQSTQTLQQTTNNSVTAGQTSVHRFNQTGSVVPTQVNYQSSATVSAIPTSLNLSLSKGSANVSNISQITVGGSQGGCSQTPHVQLPLNTINAVVSGQTSVANQTVPIGQIHQVGSSVASVVTPSNVQVSGTQSQGTVTTHQIVYSPRTTHRLVPATQLSSAQTTFNAGLSSVTKQTSTPISSSDSTPAMQSALAQYQATTVTGYSVTGNTAGSSRTTAGSTSSQQYQSSSSSKTSQQVIQTVGGIQVRHKSHSATANSPPNTPALLQVTSTASSQNISNAPNLPSGHNQSHHGTMGNTASIVVHTPKQSTISHNVHSSSGLGMTSHGSSHNTHHTNSATVNLGTHHGTNPPSVQLNPNPQSGQTQYQNNSSFQRLKVEDALSYLDKVKFKFGDQPQVYNDFLDIMKEFKSQSIDTPGVIDRVSSLFKEHPELIEGFNTFLPPGYKIEVKAIDQGYAYQVSVSMPSPTQSTTTVVHTQGLRQGISSPPMSTNQTSGSIVQSQNTKSAPVMQILQGSGIIHTTLVSNVPCGTPSQSQSSVPNTALQVPSSVSVTHSGSSHTSNTTNLHHTTYTSSNISVSGNNQHSNNNVHHSSTISQAQAHQAVSQALSQVETGHPTPQNQPVEFNHAINYVNKIKNRFQGQPEKYKRFLEILHTYQKEQRSMKEPNSTTGGIGNTSTLGHISSNVSLTGTVGGKHLTEAEVYSQVAKLFENQDDLLAEFGQFLPDATSHQSNLSSGKPLTNDSHVKKPIMKPAYNNSNRDRERDRERENREREHRDREHRETLEREREFREREREHRDRERNNVSTQKYGHTSGQIKRSPPYLPQNISHRDGPPMKKHKIASCRDVTIAEAGKYGALSDYAFFDKVRKALRTQEVYENFLRCLILFNEEIISKSELVQLTGPFLGKFPELFKWFKDFIGHNDTGIEPIPNNVARQERPQGDNALEVDLTTCKRLGASYCALPKANSDSSYGSPISNSIFPSGTQTHANSLQGSRKCSGRTALCREVLNDTWVSFPTWSEDSTFVTNRKTQFEEYIYRCEDERFELDVVIETNASTIRVLEGVCRRLQRLSQDELQRFRLDDTLGGTSAVLHQRALRRIYGDKAPDIVDGLKRNPAVAVPVVLRRLKAKEDEWREAQKSFNKIWREQNEKYYLKSLDHQGINFKQNDVKSLRSKSLFNEIETLYDERHEQNEEGATSAATGSAPSNGPHLILSYAAHMTPNSSIPANPVTAGAALGPLGNGTPPGPIVRGVLDDAASLLIHHVRRQTGVQKQEKARIKSLLRQFIPDLFHHPRQQLSDDERDDDDDKEEDIDGNLRSSPTISDSKSGIKSITNTTNIKKSPNHDSSTSTSGETDSKLNVGNESLTVEDIDLSLVKMEEDEKVPPHAITDDPDEYYTLFMANNNWYLFLRLHAILCSRLATIHAHAQRLIEQERTERVRRKQSTAVALRLKPQPDVEVEQYYPAFLDMVKNVLDGNMDATAYEDTLREMFGIHAYIAFTLDKVVSYAVRQLQHCATERGAIECCNMFLHERRKAYPGYNGTNNSNRKESIRDKDFFKNLSKDVYSLVKNSSGNWKSGSDLNSFTSGAGGPCSTAHRRKAAEATYQRSSEMLLRDENCFKIYIYKNNLRVTIELLDTETDDADPQSSMAEAQKWSNYVERFANHTPTSTSTDKIKENSRRSGNSAINQDGKNCDSVKNCDSSNVQNSDSAIIEKGSRKRFDRDRAVEVKEEKNLSDQDDNETGMETILGGWSNRKATFLKRNVRDFHQRAERTTISSVSTSKKNENTGLVNELHKTSSADRISPEIDKSEHMNELERKLIEKGLPQRVNTLNVANDFVVDDKTQCRFDLNSYKMVFIVNKESFLYKKDAFTKAKKCHPIVTKQLNSRFRVWHKRWLNIHVTEAQQKATYDWLMGRTDGLCPNRTRTLSNNDIRRTPYAPYNRYKVERLQPSSIDPDSG